MILRISLALIMLAVLAACNSKQGKHDLKIFIDEVKSRPPTGISPAPDPAEAESFLYVAADRRDPFAPRVGFNTAAEVTIDTGIRPDTNRRREELENYALDSLQMVGTLEQKGEVWGLVQTADGIIHRVARGNYMGQNHGQIIAISEDKINLIELVQLGRGFQEQEAALSLDGNKLSGETDAR